MGTGDRGARLFEDIRSPTCGTVPEDARDSLEEAQRAAHLGNWEWDALNDQITGPRSSTAVRRCPGRLSRFSQFVERLHPDDESACSGMSRTH